MANLYHHLLGDRAEPDAIFVRELGGQTLTYRGLDEATARYANLLVARGVAPGDRVAVQADKSLDVLLLYLGCVRMGGVFLPLNPAYTAAEAGLFLDDAQPALVVADAARAAALAAAGRAAERLDRIAAEAEGGSAAFATIDRADDALAALLYTSGTTGRSKGAMLTHGNLASNALVLRDRWRFTADDVLLHALPVFHTHGLFVATNTMLAAGASMIFLPRFDLDAVVAALPGASVLMGVPTFYIRLAADDRVDRAATAHMRLFVSGSAPLSADVHRRFAERTGHAVLERYGMTETNMNTSNPYDGERRAGTVGLPLPGVDVRIVDGESGAPLPTGETGAIQVAGPNVFTGYWRMPDKTAEDFDGAWFRTGDLGRFDADGYLSIVGRAKDLIIAGGLNIYPAEVEAALDDLPEVAEAAVIGVPHPDLGEAVVAVVVGAAADPAAIGRALAGGLARFKQPRRIVVVETLPRNAMGKIEKAALRHQYRDLFGPAAG